MRDNGVPRDPVALSPAPRRTMLGEALLPDLIALVQILFIDLVLAGDNAIVVGMAAASVPPALRRRVIVWGTLVAVVLRILFALVAVQLLAIIGLTLAGGLLLAFVCFQMYRELTTHGRDEVTPDQALHAPATPARQKTVLAAVWQVGLADLSMSLDNVLAVAGVARDHTGMLVLGLLLSVIMMAFAATLIARLLHRYRWLGWAGLVIITYVALDMIYRGGGQVWAVLAG
jgi:YjbE family integral membrane protein